MERYEKYKPSGIEWIGDIPSKWNIKKLKYNTYIKARVGWHGLKSDEFSLDEKVYCVTGTDFKNGAINWESCYKITEERYDEDPYIQLRENDLLITKDGTIGKVAVVKGLNGKATLNSGVFVVRPENDEYSTDFMYWALQSVIFSEFVNYTAKGSTINHLYQDTFFNLPFLIPSCKEQTTIANYLDQKTAEIDHIISKKQQLIELLKEERTAVINEAVSGEGKNWEKRKLKYLVSKIGSGITPSGGANVYQQDGIPLLRSQNIYSTELRLDDVAYISEEIDEKMSNSRIQDGDILLNITGASIGRCFYVPAGFGKGNVNQHVCIIRPIKSEIETEYLHLFLISNIGQTFIDMCQNGANREGLNFQQIKSFTIPLPGLSDQKKVVQNLKKETQRIDYTISKIEKEISLLQEYRTALISEVVTGKIKVT